VESDGNPSARPALDPSDFGAAALLSRQYQDSGELQRAENLWRQFLSTHPGHLPARTQLAHVLWRSGKTGEALQELRKRLRAMPQSAGAWKTLVNWHGQLEQSDKAMVAAREWLEAMPDCGPAYFQLGHLLVREDLYEPALTHLERAASDPEVAIDAALGIAQARLQMEELEPALRQLHQCLAESARFMPRHVGMVINLAHQLHSQRQFQAVVDCCKAVRSVNADDPLWLALYTSSLRQLGRNAESEQFSGRFSDILRLRRGTAIDSARLARALWLLERFDEALEEIRESLRIRSESEATWRMLVRWLEKLERAEHSLDAARSWLAAMPGSVHANWEVARMLIHGRRYEEAWEHIDQALADTTATIEPGFKVVQACLAEEQAGLASQLTERLLAAPERILSRHAQAIMMLARAFHAGRHYLMAEHCCGAIAENRENDPAFLALYGHVLLSKGEVERAKAVLERSVFLSPRSDSAPRLLLALSYIHHGNAELGRAYLSEAAGFQEEGRVFVELFGNAAPLIPYYGAEIDRALASDERS